MNKLSLFKKINNIKNYFTLNSKKEPWQIALARFCVEKSEKGFTKADLEKYTESMYISKKQLNQFWEEEIQSSAGRQYARNSFTGIPENRWMAPLDLVSKVTDYEELKEARKNARQAFWLSIIAIIISATTLYISLRLGENQLEASQNQVGLQKAIWNYEQMRNDRIETRDIQWRREDLQSQGRLPY